MRLAQGRLGFQSTHSPASQILSRTFDHTRTCLPVPPSRDSTCHVQAQPSSMGKRQGAIVADGLNRKRMSNNRKKNLKNKQNRKNILEKKAAHPSAHFTSQPL